MPELDFAALLRSQNCMCSVSDADYEKALNEGRERVAPREGVECARCKNHEYIWRVVDGERMTQDCPCREKRNSLRRIRQSGLSDQLARCTFDAFRTDEPWQATAKEIVQRFVRDRERRWLLVSGEPGSGKSHLCTAAAGKFIGAGVSVRYMRWVDESTALKACVNDDMAYRKRLEPLKKCKVLYIDDFWKTQRGQSPTPADVKLAFDLLDHRYCNRGLVTMLSTERTIEEMIEIDAAVGSRIYEMTRGYRLEIVGAGKNWRLTHG